MADYTYSKEGLGALYQENEVAAEWTDLEPVITPGQLRRIHLLGIPLVAGIKNPMTGRPDVIDDLALKDFILQACSLAEAEAKLDFFPRQYVEKLAFDRAEYDSFGYMQLRHRPVWSLEALTVTPSNEQPVYQIPNEWIDVGYLHLGQINLIPLTIALKTGTVVPLTTSPGGATFLSIFGNRPWIPSFFEARYTTGFKNGLVPKLINQYIGTVAAMEVLSALAATYSRSSSTSLSMDGVSQSVATPGGDLYTTRLKDLADKRKWIVGRLQASFGMSFFTGNV